MRIKVWVCFAPLRRESMRESPWN